MTEIDFITALGRLLRDGNLRDAFAADPEAVARQINLSCHNRPAFLQLVPGDLEFQARILLRKRLEFVRQLLMETGRRLGEDLWPHFLEYARTSWPTGPHAALQDAFQFCRHLKKEHPRLVSQSEWNRLSFALCENHLAIHCLLRENILKKTSPRLQIFYRGRSKRWCEFMFHFGL